MNDVTVKEWNAVREEMMKFNPDLRSRPLTKYLFMSTKEIMQLTDGFIVPQDYLALLAMVPEGKKKEDVYEAIKRSVEKAMSGRKPRLSRERGNEILQYLASVIGKNPSSIKNALRTERPRPPQSLVAKPKIPTPQSIQQELTAQETKKSEELETKAPRATQKIEPVSTNYIVESNVCNGCIMVVSVHGNVIRIEEYDSKTTKPIQAGDGRILVLLGPDKNHFTRFYPKV